MLFRFRKFHVINELSLSTQTFKPAQRGEFKIAIVDDEVFLYLDQLRRLGFNITTYKDVTDLNMLYSYDVIISDIKGVGKDFNSEFEGAFLLRELKKKYPYKGFAAYTGSAFDIRINTFLVDIQIIKKDITIDEWCNAIDSLIRNISDPKTVWNRIRKDLLDKEVSLLDLERLEDEFVDRVLNRNCDFSNFPSQKAKKHISTEALNLLSSIASNLLAKLLLTV